LVLGLISIFLFIVSGAVLYMEIHISRGDVCSCSIPLIMLIPIVASAGLVVGAFMFYLLYPSTGLEKSIKPLVSRLFSYLSREEREVIMSIGDQSLALSTISKKTGIVKVRVYRILKRLVEKGLVVKTDRYYELSEPLKRNIGLLRADDYKNN
ncbi:hypothetical protein J7K74_00220, partial [Candidatus Woesearchaeota archaeon]|nr:hypothetical protein [Candidatus Woesearchaeota archaeon]